MSKCKFLCYPFLLYFRPKRCLAGRQACWQAGNKRMCVCVCAYSNACVIRYGWQAILLAKSLKCFYLIFVLFLSMMLLVLLLLFGLHVCIYIPYSYDFSCLLMGIMLFCHVVVHCCCRFLFQLLLQFRPIHPKVSASSV